MTIGIPSYKRPNLKTISFLGNAFDKSEIVIGTQTEYEYEQYSKLWGNIATVIFGSAKSAAGNRNNILDYVQENGTTEILFLDDDISYVRTINDLKLKGAQFRELVERCFSVCRKNNVILFGGYTCSNKLMMSNTAKPNIIDGMLMGLLDTSIRFDLNFTTKEDYELSLRLMSKGKRVVRFNSFAAQAESCSKGGCEDIRNGGGQGVMAKLLIEAYPSYVKEHPTRKGEIKFIR